MHLVLLGAVRASTLPVGWCITLRRPKSAAVWDRFGDRWGVGPALAEALFLLPFGGAVAIVLARDHKPLFRFLTSEDSVFEWPQFVGFAAASILAFACAWKLRTAGRPLLALAYFAFGLGCFFVAGEEIAWASASSASERRSPLRRSMSRRR